MSESKEIVDVNSKWDSYLDLGVRRFVYSSAAGALAGLLLFRSPVTRWASIAFGAGVGIGSAYTECSHKFEGDVTLVSKAMKAVVLTTLSFLPGRMILNSVPASRIKVFT